MGVQIFTQRPPDGHLEVLDVLALLENYPQALILYLDFLIHDLNNEVCTNVSNRLIPLLNALKDDGCNLSTGGTASQPPGSGIC